MHEVSIMAQTLEVAFEQAKQHQATTIHRLKMRIGEMSGVVPEALEFAFDAMKEGTIALRASQKSKVKSQKYNRSGFRRL